jgi:hypothetical protein
MTPRIERRDISLVLVTDSGQEYVAIQPNCGTLHERGQPVTFGPLENPDDTAGAAYSNAGRIVFLFHDTWRQVAFDREMLRRLMLCGAGASVSAEVPV